MTADERRDNREDSRRPSAVRGALASGVLPRTALAAAGLAGALLLLVATVTTVIQIRVGTVDRLDGIETAFSGWDRHGPALVLLGLAALAMLAGALRGARPAMAALAVLGAVALLLAVATDLPDADETGQVGELYSEASARAAFGFYAETLGGALLLAAGGGLLILSGGAKARAARRRPRRPVTEEG